MKQSRRKFLKFLLVASGALAIGKIFGFNWVSQAKASPGWTEPTQTPPSGNVPAPLNVGSTDQTKQGGLTIQGSLKVNSRLKIPVGTNLFD